MSSKRMEDSETGDIIMVRRPRDQWKRREVPRLRIVLDDDLWQKTQKRLQECRETYLKRRGESKSGPLAPQSIRTCSCALCADTVGASFGLVGLGSTPLSAASTVLQRKKGASSAPRRQSGSSRKRSLDTSRQRSPRPSSWPTWSRRANGRPQTEHALQYGRHGIRPKTKPPCKRTGTRTGPPKYKTMAVEVARLRDVLHYPFAEIALQCEISEPTVRRAYDFAHRDQVIQAAQSGKRPDRGYYIRAGIHQRQEIVRRLKCDEPEASIADAVDAYVWKQFVESRGSVRSSSISPRAVPARSQGTPRFWWGVFVYCSFLSSKAPPGLRRSCSVTRRKVKGTDPTTEKGHAQPFELVVHQFLDVLARLIAQRVRREHLSINHSSCSART